MMRFAQSVTLTGVLTFLLWPAAPCPAQQQQKREPARNSTAELSALQKERAEAFSQLARIQESQYKVGQLELRRLVATETQLLDATVELGGAPEARIARLEELLTKTKGLLEFTELRYRAGYHTTQADVLEIKSLHLNIKIRLAQERANLESSAR